VLQQPLGRLGLADLRLQLDQLGLGKRLPAVTGRGRVGDQLGQLGQGKAGLLQQRQHGQQLHHARGVAALAADPGGRMQYPRRSSNAIASRRLVNGQLVMPSGLTAHGRSDARLGQ
jgi:hypothetical protein